MKISKGAGATAKDVAKALIEAGTAARQLEEGVSLANNDLEKLMGTFLALSEEGKSVDAVLEQLRMDSAQMSANLDTQRLVSGFTEVVSAATSLLFAYQSLSRIGEI